MSPSRSRKRPSEPQATTARARKPRLAAAVVSDVIAVAVVPPSNSSPWTSLPGDMVQQIAWRVLAGDFLDYVRFRAVCTSWRSGTVCPRGGRGVTDPRFHPRRWMMLPEGHGLYPGHRKLGGYVRFFNLDTGAFVRVKLPLFRNHCALDSTDGLLLLQRDEDTAVCLLHPFTGDIIELPPLATLLTQLDNDLPIANPDPELAKWYWIRYGICASVSCSGGSIIVMLMFRRLRRLAFATSQGQQWTMSSWDIPAHIAPLAFQGKLYLVRQCFPTANGSLVFQIDPPLQAGSPPLPPKLIATCPGDKLYYGFHLVECNSQILLVGHNNVSLSHIVIYKLEDLILERFTPVKSIGDCALFLNDKCLSVSAKALPTVMSESVVYRHPTRYHFAQYQLNTGTWSRPIDSCGLDGLPGPRSLIQHIITCCIRNVWNKGLLCSIKESKKAGLLVWKVKRKLRLWS